MSLEQSIKDLTAAVEANTKALAAGGGKTSAGGGSKSSSGGKKLTIDAVAKKFSAYLAAEGDDAKANVRAIVKHLKAKKVTELPEESFDEALKLLAAFEDGENPLAGDDDDLM